MSKQMEHCFMLASVKNVACFSLSYMRDRHIFRAERRNMEQKGKKCFQV